MTGPLRSPGAPVTAPAGGEAYATERERHLHQSLVACRRALDDITFRMKAVAAENDVLKVERGILEAKLRVVQQAPSIEEVSLCPALTRQVGACAVPASRKRAEEAQQDIARKEMRCGELERDLEGKLAQLERDRADVSREREAELSRIRADMLRLREEEQRELTGQRREVEEQRLQLQIARDSFGDAMAEAKLSREEGVELKAEIKRQQLQVDTLR